MMKPIMEVEALGFKKSSRWLVQDVSLKLCPGEILVLIGPNGAGKSSLLKLVSGELAASAGRVVIHGKAIEAWRPPALARCRAVLSQHQAAPFGFNVATVAALSLPMMGVRHDAALIEEMLRLVGLAHLASKPISLLSGGECQRVHLARALVQLRASASLPGLLLLDEPLSAQDINQQQKILGIVRDYVQGGNAAIIILHDLNWASEIATSLAVMAQGRIFVQGAPEHVLTREMFSTIYDMDILPTRLEGSGKPLILPMILKPPSSAAARDRSRDF